MATVPTEMQLRKRRSAIRISLVERKRADAALAKVPYIFSGIHL